jgi:hypothetical protein
MGEKQFVAMINLLDVGYQIDRAGSTNSNYWIQHNLAPNLLWLNQDLFLRDGKQSVARHNQITVPPVAITVSHEKL